MAAAAGTYKHVFQCPEDPRQGQSQHHTEQNLYFISVAGAVGHVRPH